MGKGLCLVGLNHRTAGVETRETFALAGSDFLENTLFLPVGAEKRASSPIREVMALSTCNRVEILAAGKGDELAETLLAIWAAARGGKTEDLRPFVYVRQEDEAVRHLFSVASSLDSMILGEPQILGQLKDAYKNALESGSTGTILNRLLHHAFYAAKRVRSETGVAAAAVSVSYAAVELAKRIFGDMSSYQAMLIGAGEMAELSATHLMNAGIKSILVANRTRARAVELAARYGGRDVPFEELVNYLPEVDIVISSTGASEAIIRAEDMAGVMKKRKNRPMFFIDIAVPRDIDPGVNSLDNIYLYDIDDLKEVVEENLAQRREEAVKAADIVEEETRKFRRWLEALEVQPTIVALLQHSERIIREEWARTSRRLELGLKETQALEQMLEAIVKKINHKPIVFLKKLAEDEGGAQYADMVRRLFGLDEERTAELVHGRHKRHETVSKIIRRKTGYGAHAADRKEFMTMRTELTRDKAWELLRAYNQEEFHLRHALILEGVMRWFAVELGYAEDQDFWALAGLLHDVDFERFPQEHCRKAPEILRPAGAGEALIHAVCSHGYGLTAEVRPEHEMEKVLYAVDELTGLIGAAALMRPSKSVQDMEVKSLKKKYKTINFAAGCSREVIENGAAMLGWELEVLMEKTLLAMRACEEAVPESASL
jgi:glutamyl-tRNA reductase